MIHTAYDVTAKLSDAEELKSEKCTPFLSNKVDEGHGEQKPDCDAN